MSRNGVATSWVLTKHVTNKQNYLIRTDKRNKRALPLLLMRCRTSFGYWTLLPLGSIAAPAHVNSAPHHD